MNNKKLFSLLIILFGVIYSSLISGQTLINIKVTVSSIENNNPDLKPENVMDGDMNTRWASDWSDPQWLIIDPGKTISLIGLKIYWETAYAREYEILISRDKTNWEKIYYTDQGHSGVDDIDIDQQEARYLKILFKKRGTKWGNSIFEIILKTPEESFGIGQKEPGYIIKYNWDGRKNPGKIIYVPKSWEKDDTQLILRGVQDGIKLSVNGHLLPTKSQVLKDRIKLDIKKYIKFNAPNLFSMKTSPAQTESIIKTFLLKKNEKAFNEIEIKDGWFYVNGEKFLVKGMHYCGGYWTGNKWVYNSLEITDHEFRRIKEAGFNTIFTSLKPSELEIAKKHDLMVINIAAWLCFNTNYKSPAVLDQVKETVDFSILNSIENDNILYNVMDNEPDIKAVYKEGEKFMVNCWRMIDKRIKELRYGAFTSVKMMPPSAFADVSMCDVICLNLYPGGPREGALDYAAYANWYKRKFALNKPFIISEYGWTGDLKDFGTVTLQMSDDQIKSGACGSVFFLWCTGGKEKTDNDWWWGIIPHNELGSAHLNTPRSIYNDFQKYFQAVAIEPKVRGVYAKKLPLEIYGTDKTGSVKVELDNKIIKLKKQGKYWWLGEINFGPESYGEKTVTIEAKDKDNHTLVRKNINVFLCAEKKSLSVQILRDKKQLISGQPYQAKIIIVDEKGKRVPNQPLALSVNQSQIDVWAGTPIKAVTDSNGEYLFEEKIIFPEYYTLMAQADTSRKDVETFADVDISRVEKNPAVKDNQLDSMNTISGWAPWMDNSTIMNLAITKYKTDQAFEISYEFNNGGWIALDEKTFHDFSSYQGIKLTFRDSGIKNNIEFKVIDQDGSVFITNIKERSNGDNWKTVKILFNDLPYGWGGDRNLDLASAKLSIGVSKKGDVDQSSGKLIIGKIEIIK